ncbi:MAG TPA: dihydroorotase [Candidatus Thermoplasmatota archaeon]|nr:dihydroorotase [Candidatus Thermoplasmatota archaeon]
MAAKRPTKPSKSKALPSKSRPPKPKPSKAKTGPKAKAAPKGTASKAKPSTTPPTTSPRAAPSAKPAKTMATASRGADLSVSGQIYQRGKLVPGILHIDTQKGRIVSIAKSTRLATHLDLGNRAILPGAIDIHVHFREPGHTHKEDFTTGSTAAAFGGVTGFVDMPNTLPATISARTLKEKLALAQRKSLVDYAAWAGGTWYTGELPEMLKWAVGVKTYLGASTGDLLLEDQTRFAEILLAAGKEGAPVALHCESQRILQQLRRNEGTLEDHDLARPPLAEVEAIYDVMKALAGVKKAPPVHIAHIASPDAVAAASTAKFSLGACPHHLLLDSTVGLSHAYGKMNPPLRSPTVRKAMWDAFAAGRIPILESDHAPHTKVEKEDSFHNAPSGVPGVETMVPLMLAQVGAKLTLGRVVDAVTVGPANLLGLKDRAVLEPGTRADFAVYDLKKPTKVVSAELHSKCGWSPYDGLQAVFPTHTFLAGKPVMQDGQLVAKPGMAGPLKPLPGALPVL